MFWQSILKGAMWVANYAADHPDQIVALVKTVKQARQ